MGFVEDELKHLKEVIGSLDSRIKQLEQRSTGTVSTTDEVRMIIMGPPGAGKSRGAPRHLQRIAGLTMSFRRQGHTSA